MNGPKQSRRGVLKMIGGGAVVGGTGLAAMSGAASAASGLNISNGDAGLVRNDRGNVNEVLIKPRLAVDWNGFDEVADRLRVLVEARLEKGPGGAVHPDWKDEVDGLRNDVHDALGNDYGGYPLLQDSYVPVYRETPWLDNDQYYPEQTTTEGTSGRFPESGRAPLFSRASERTDREESYFTSEPPADEIPPIVLFSDADARPDYAGLPDSDGDVSEDAGRYLSGISISGGGNFLNGSYGSAGDTSLIDSEQDDATKTSHVGLRFTVSLRTSTDNTPLAMNGADGYPSHDEDGDPSHGWEQYNRGYAGLQSIADSHPAVLVERTQLTVSAENIGAEASGSGGLGGGVN